MKKLVAIMLTLVLGLTAVGGCSGSPTTSGTASGTETQTQTQTQTQTAAASGAIKIIFGTGASEASYFGQSLKYLEEIVNERMAGEVEFKVYLGEQLGDATSMLENLQVDLQQGWGDSLDTLATYAPDLNITTMAFAFKSTKHVDAFLGSDVGKSIFNKLESNNIVVTDYSFDRLPRSFVSTKPIAKASDMKGLKWRIPNIEIYEKNFSALGAVPTYVAWSEYPYALMTGVVDAGDASQEDIVPNGLYLSAPYISLVEYAYPKNCVVLNTQTWNKMTAGQQETYTKCCADAAAYFRDLLETAWEADQKTILDSKGEFVEIDRQSFLDAVVNYASELEAANFWDTKDLYDHVQSLSY